MSVRRVQIVSPDEQYEPPEKVIEVDVIGEDVFLNVVSLSEKEQETREYEVPRIRLHDLIAALNAFADVTQGVLFHPRPRREEA